MKKKSSHKDASPDWASVPMSPEARAYYQNTFLPQYESRMQEIADEPLAILVWGPGPSGGDLHDKRLQVRAELRSQGMAAFFSEEIEADTAGCYTSLRAIEMCQALAADFIIVIQGSPGSTAEVHDFGRFIKDIGHKLLIFIDEPARGGYSYSGLLQELKSHYNCVETFSYPNDITECNLVRAIERKVHALQVTKWFSSFK